MKIFNIMRKLVLKMDNKWKIHHKLYVNTNKDLKLLNKDSNPLKMNNRIKFKQIHKIVWDNYIKIWWIDIT